jgi:hypothetical protein
MVRLLMVRLLMVRLLMVRLLMVRLLMVRLLMVPHRGVPVVAVHVRERHRRGSERSYDEDSKSLLENLFHGNPGGQDARIREKRDAMSQTTAMRRHLSALSGSESTG